MYYLYVKTHNITGIKYLGQTIRDPFKYRGSGKIWRRHIKKHGYDVRTEILLQTESKAELVNYGLYYSRVFDVVSSSDWANLKEETGDGGFSNDSRLKSKSPESIQKIKDNHWSKKRPIEQKEHASKAAKSRLMTDDIRKSISNSLILKNKTADSHYNKGKKREIVSCPHCDKSGAKNTLTRWHFDNCKYKNSDVVIMVAH
jgi:hypothetical protein